MTHDDIKKAVVSQLVAKFPTGYKIYDEQVPAKFTKPCFFIEIVPILKTNMGANYDHKVITVKVHFFPQEDKLAPINAMVDTLGDVFRSILPVLDRKLHIISTSSRIIDYVLYFSFDLDFIDTYIDPNAVQYDYMQNLQIEGI